MCGVGTITLDKTAPLNLDLDGAASALALALDHRGGDATGLLAISADGACDVQKAVCAAEAFNRYRLPLPDATRAVVVHTRFATQGPEAFNRNNHPVRAGVAMVAHNGVIWERVRRLPGQPEVDTYVLAVAADECAVRRAHETPTEHGQRIARALASWDGSAAVAVAFEGAPFLLTAKLSGSPLYSASAGGVRVAASTRDAVADAFEALGLTLPTHTYNVTETYKKRGKKRTRQVQRTAERIDYCDDGACLVWYAGAHTAAAIPVPKWPTYGSAIGSYPTGSYSYTATPTRDADRVLGAAAQALLDESAERCDCCDEWYDSAALTAAFGGLVCDDCLAAMAETEATADDGSTVVYRLEAGATDATP